MKPPVEVKWFWRRLVVIGVLIVSFALIAMIITRTHDAQALRWLGSGLIILSGLTLIAYITGATATDFARLAAALKSGTAPPPAPEEKDQ